MAYNKYSNNDEEGKFSEFNSAGLKMKRLDWLLHLLNTIRLNMEAFNNEYGKYNYELSYDLITGLYLEIESKLTSDEKTEIESLRHAVEEVIYKYPVYNNIKSLKYPHNIQVSVNQNLLRTLKKWLFRYEQITRKYQDEHGMDTAYGDEEALF